MPRADDIPSMTLAHHTTLGTTNELHVKGCGEAGATGAPAAFVSAVLDALKARGVSEIDMPVTQQKVWRALND